MKGHENRSLERVGPFVCWTDLGFADMHLGRGALTAG